VQRSADRRAELAGGQAPFATVFTCLDSRVAPEVVFDCAIGDLAVIRTGGHVLDDAVVLGSLEFSASILRTPLLLVMGHESCGAVRGAVEAIGQDRRTEGGIQAIVDALRPAYESAGPTARTEEELVDLMVREHTRLTARALAAGETISSLIEEGSLAIRGGIYALGTGEVSLID
jgi:carbonic anhydrase